MNSHIPEEYGGAGAGFLDGCLIEEELSWGCSGIQTSLGCNGLATAPIQLGGSEEVEEASTSGCSPKPPSSASFCLTEPDAGSDVSGMRTTAVRHGDKYLLNGSKCFITNGGYADYYTVYAKTDKDAGHRGISAFVVERDWGVVVDKKEDKLGQRASNTATISFNDVEVPAENLLGEENTRLQARDDDPRPHPPRSGRDGHRHRPGGVRVRHRLRPRTGPVRRADRDAPGDPVHDRRHGHRNRGRPPADVEVRHDARRGRTQHAGFLARQALRRRRRDENRRPTPSRSTAATASSRTTRSRSCSATPRSCSSTRAPPRSSVS